MNTAHTKAKDPAIYGADPVLGNYTDDAEQHLWCAQALARVLAAPEIAIDEFNDDIQAALRYLLQSEIGRAHKANAA